ncbi:MAG: AI-2E family transporter [Lachnospiraceae bacterium]|nr:AI-2E family transporter [Lachnospiraceae bacterium]
MKRPEIKKYVSWGVTAFCVLAAAILLYFFCLRWDHVMSVIGGFMSMLAPFFAGVLIAYLVNPFFCFLNRHLSKMFVKFHWAKDMEAAQHKCRGLSSILALLMILLVIVSIFAIIIPEAYRSIKNIINGFDVNSANLGERLKGWLHNYPQAENFIMPYYEKMVAEIKNWFQGGAMMDWLKASAGPILSGIYSGVSTVVSTIVNTFIAFIVTVYILNSKKTFLAQSRKMLYAIGGKKMADAVLSECAYAHEVFGRYIRGALADSFVLGCVVFILMNILGLPYPLLVAVIVAMTNVIPFFGPYIGAIPSIILILLVDPMAALKFTIMILILQQVEGNIISPKIIGNTTGLNGFWVLFSIIFFGKIFGFLGLLFGVPMFAVVYHIVTNWASRRLKKKHMPTKTSEYTSAGLVDMIPDEKNIEDALDDALDVGAYAVDASGDRGESENEENH